ncbi:hypothetical protein FXO37_04022 [Capsicum annuum]|nr:hypothetical protein FXO37_04022 [Capsicum annuum]
MSILYHSGKANIVADAFSRFSIGSVAYIENDKKKLVREVYRLARLGIHLVDSAEVSVWVQNSLESSLVAEVKENQDRDPSLVKLKESARDQNVEVFSQEGDGGLGTQVYLSTAFHPQKDGPAERTIQTLEDMLRACIIDFKVQRHELQISSSISISSRRDSVSFKNIEPTQKEISFFWIPKKVVPASVCQEIKFIRGLVSSRCDQIMNAITEKNTKSIDDNIGEAHISDSQFSFSDEVLRSINLDFIKANLRVEDKSKDLPQQPSGSLDCGLYMVTYVECLTFGDLVSLIDFDSNLIHTRYTSMLWDYGMRKEKAKAQSDDEAPMRPPHEIGITEDTEVHEI